MDIYNDNWCQCPICFKIYSMSHRPTTLSCGHSVCIDHVNGGNRLEKCPICQYSLKSSNEYHVSYTLEEAVSVFNFLKTSSSWNSLTKKEKVVTESKDSHHNGQIRKENVRKTKDIPHYDRSYEKQLEEKERILDEIFSKPNNYFH